MLKCDKAIAALHQALDAHESASGDFMSEASAENAGTVGQATDTIRTCVAEIDLAWTAKLEADRETRALLLQQVDEANALGLARLAAIAWEHEAVAEAAHAKTPSEPRFKLNVGGVQYETLETTLTKVPESMLATMFGARVDMLRRDPEDGSVFIDRDGTRFGLILDFLRDGEASELASTITELPTEPQRDAMMRELNFFGLTDAVFPPRLWTIEDAEFRAFGPKLNSEHSWCAAVLHEGRVVVIGGSDFGLNALKTTEVLDLDDAGSTETSLTAGPTMATARRGGAVVRLDARRVLVVGGSKEACYLGSLLTTEILDFETMRFSVGPTMLSNRCYGTAVALDARRVLVAGGCDENGNVHGTTEILDVATMTFAPGPEMLSKRYGCSAVALENPRRVLVVGGGGRGGNFNTTEVLNLDTMTFSHGPTMRKARCGCAAVALGGDLRGRCLVVGGYDEHYKNANSTEVLDLEATEFTDGPAMPEGREGCAAVADDAGDRVLVLGGCGILEVLKAAF